MIALAGLNGLGSATLGAGASLLVVGGAGVLIRRPLSRVPENAMKYVVGVMLTAFGTFFAGEGLGVDWWNADVSLLPLIAGYGLCSVALVQLLKRPPSIGGGRALSALRAAVVEVWGLFVGDGPLAIATIAVMLAVGVFVARTRGQERIAGPILAAGVVVALLIGLADGFSRARRRRQASERTPAPEAAPPKLSRSTEPG